MYESKVPSGTRQSVLAPTPLTPLVTTQSLTGSSPRTRAISQAATLTPTSSGGLRQVDTPLAARTSKASRDGLEAVQRNLDSFFDALSKLSGKLVSRKDTFRLQELIWAIPGPDNMAEHAEALSYVQHVIAPYGVPQLAGLLISICALRRQDRQSGAQLQAIERCLRDRLLSCTREAAADELESLGALASDVRSEAAASALETRLLALPGEVLLAAAAPSDTPELLTAAHEWVDHLYDDSVRHLNSAFERVATATAEGGLPADLGEFTSLLADTVRALVDHERLSAIHDLPLDRTATAARRDLEALLRRPLERAELPLHLATPEQQEAICTALAMLEPMGTEQPREHFKAACLSRCLTRVQQGNLPDALHMLKMAQALRAQAPGVQRDGLRFSSPVHLFTRQPREALIAWANALDDKPHQLLMAALDEIGNKIFAGQTFGRDIAGYHRDLHNIRESLALALDTRVPKNKAKFGDAIRNADVHQALVKTFPLQVNTSPREVEVFAISGPVREKAQAVFDEALQRDLKLAAGARKKPNGKDDSQISDLRIAPGFAQAVKRIPCRVVNPVSAAAETVDVTGMSPDQAIAAIQLRTGATAAQMATLSRLYDADVRIDSTMFSPWSVLQFAGNVTALPLLSDARQRASRVLSKRDPSGSLKLRFVTTLTGIASVLPIVDGQLLQPRAVAQRAGSVKFTHDIELASDGTCRHARLLREHDLPNDPRTHNPGLQRRVAAQDLVANPDALRTLGHMVDRKLGTNHTEYLDNVNALLSIPNENAPNVMSTSVGIQDVFMNTEARFKPLGISATARARIAVAIEESRGSLSGGAVDRIVNAFRATKLEVAQTILDQTKALLAANSATRA